jgi:hexosaminidase
MKRPDAEQIKAELTQAAHLTKHGLSHLMFQQEIGDIPVSSLHDEVNALITTQQATWLARHRPGGLEDSIARLELLKDTYKKRL